MQKFWVIVHLRKRLDGYFGPSEISGVGFSFEQVSDFDAAEFRLRVATFTLDRTTSWQICRQPHLNELKKRKKRGKKNKCFYGFSFAPY